MYFAMVQARPDRVNELLSYGEDPGLGDKSVDEGGECILQEGGFWSTGGQHTLIGYYMLFTFTS